MQFLHHAIEKNDIGKLKELLNNKETDINQLDDYGYSALHIASRKGFMEIAMLLVESGIDVNAKDKNGQTILHYVAVYNQLELARLILAKNSSATLSIEDMHGNQPLWTAVFNDKGKNDRIAIVELYKKMGGDFNHKNHVGKSPCDIIMIAGYNNLKHLLD